MMGTTAFAVRSQIARRATGTRSLWERIGRLVALSVIFAAIDILPATIIRGISPLSDNAWWGGYNLYALCYLYLLTAIWLGDIWEAGAALVLSATTALGIMWAAPEEHHALSTGELFFYVARGAAMIALAYRNRGPHDTSETAVPLVAADLDDSVLLIKGHVQIVRGGGVIFDDGGIPQEARMSE